MLKIIPYCFTKNDIICNFSNKFQFDNWIKTNINNDKIKKVRNGLYVSLDSMKNIYSTKFEIASKITKDSYISYHSALEYYGIANQVFSDVIVCSSNKFNNFQFEDVEYICKISKNYVEVLNIASSNVRVTSLERTIIDCIANINISGGIEEILNALEQIKVLNENKLLNVLESYNQIFLYQKVGFILEQYKNELNLSNEFFEQCKSKLSSQIKYFLKDEYKDISYNSKWQLMAPTNLKSRINGGL